MVFVKYLYSEYSLNKNKGYGYTYKKYGPAHILGLCLLWLILPLTLLIRNPIDYFKNGGVKTEVVQYRYVKEKAPEPPPEPSTIVVPDIIEIEVEKIVKVEKYQLSNEMRIASDYIKSNYGNLPRIVADSIAYEVYTQAEKNNLNPALIMGIIEAESKFNPTLTSRSGAKGLMQVLDGGPRIHIDWERVFDIEYNISKGIEILKAHLKMVGGSMKRALDNYSGGHNGYSGVVMRNMGGYIIYREDAVVKTMKDENFGR